MVDRGSLMWGQVSLGRNWWSWSAQTPQLAHGYMAPLLSQGQLESGPYLRRAAACRDHITRAMRPALLVSQYVCSTFPNRLPGSKRRELKRSALGAALQRSQLEDGTVMPLCWGGDTRSAWMAYYSFRSAIGVVPGDGSLNKDGRMETAIVSLNDCVATHSVVVFGSGGSIRPELTVVIFAVENSPGDEDLLTNSASSLIMIQSKERRDYAVGYRHTARQQLVVVDPDKQAKSQRDCDSLKNGECAQQRAAECGSGCPGGRGMPLRYVLRFRLDSALPASMPRNRRKPNSRVAEKARGGAAIARTLTKSTPRAVILRGGRDSGG